MYDDAPLFKERTLSGREGGSSFRNNWLRRRAGDTGSSDDDARSRVEAALFVADRPLSPSRLARVAVLRGAADAKTLVDELNASYDTSRAAFRVELQSSGYRLLTRPVHAYFLGQLVPRRDELAIPPAMFEALTIIAYRQPVTRAEVEAIRGVATLELIKQLMDRGLVKIVGEDDSLGRPFLYGTTPTFLDAFGYSSLDELPDRDTLAA